jgi:hypothetical protein
MPTATTAPATPQRIRAGCEVVEVAVLQITEKGRRALAAAKFISPPGAANLADPFHAAGIAAGLNKACVCDLDHTHLSVTGTTLEV